MNPDDSRTDSAVSVSFSRATPPPRHARELASRLTVTSANDKHLVRFVGVQQRDLEHRNVVAKVILATQVSFQEPVQPKLEISLFVCTLTQHVHVQLRARCGACALWANEADALEQGLRATAWRIC